MGACSSSRSTDAVVIDASDGHFGDDLHGSPPSSAYRYLSELHTLDQSTGFHRARWRRGAAAGIHGRSVEQERQRRIEVENLQRSLAVMEDVFQSLLGQAQLYMEAMDPAGDGSSGPPPASRSALVNLQRVSLTGDDFENEDNRSCGICCETQAVGDAVTRLPCGHIYHGACIEAWLNRHCTCPVCRYELATDDESYEPGRIERMATRKSLISDALATDLVECYCDDAIPKESDMSDGTEESDVQSRVEP